MPTSNAKLHVLTQNRLAGELLKEQQQIVFRYQSDTPHERFVSLTMPVRARSYEHKTLPPIFEMHLPEGYLLSVLQRHFAKLAGSDHFSLLNLLAPSIRGRIQYETPLKYTPPTPLHLDHLLNPTDGLFDELMKRFALNSAISGVQPKVLAQVQDKATLQLEGYIVKTWGNDYPQLALNEYWCMKVVQAANIPVPEFYLSDDARFFIMKRFDITDGNYLGFEDACVLQGKNRDEKYEGSYEQLAKTLQRFVSPQHKAAAMKQFFKMMILNMRLQNGDAHLKNFGVLYTDTHNIWLAPAYDVVSTTAYIKNDASALTLMGSRKWWPRKNLVQFAQQHCLLSQQQANTLYDECERAMKTIATKIEGQKEQSLRLDQQTTLKHLLGLLKQTSAAF